MLSFWPAALTTAHIRTFQHFISAAVYPFVSVAKPPLLRARKLEYALNFFQNAIPAVISRQAARLHWDILGKQQGRRNEMDKQRARRSASIPVRIGHAAAWAAGLWKQEHLRTLITGAQRFVLCAVLAQGTILGWVHAVRAGDDGGLDGSRSGSVGARRSGVRRHAARRRIPRRHLRRGSAAGAVRDERVCRSARDVRAVVCARCGNVCKRGVYVRVSAARRRADRTGGADIPARAGHHVWRVLDVRRGLCTARATKTTGADR